MSGEIILFIVGGVGVGVVTGLLPGLHPNTLFALLVGGAAGFSGVGLLSLLVFIVSLAVSNTFVAFIPSLFFGAPETETALGTLPGHRYMLRGKGQEALLLMVMGGVGVTVLAVVTLPVLLVVIPALQEAAAPVLHLLLVIVVLWMCWTDRSPAAAGLIFLLAGYTGVVVLPRFPAEVVMFPALTGLFGFSQLLLSLQSGGAPPVQGSASRLPRGVWKGVAGGYLAGFFTALFPGIGPGQASVLAAQTFQSKEKDFLVSLGGLGAANTIFTFVVFFAAGKTRSGAVWALSQMVPSLGVQDMVVLAAAGLAACFLAAALTITIGQRSLRVLATLNYRTMTKGLIIIVAVMVAVMTGVVGLVVALATTCLGIVCVRVGVRRTHLMGFLVMPTILFFAGLMPWVGLVTGG